VFFTPQHWRWRQQDKKGITCNSVIKEKGGIQSPSCSSVFRSHYCDTDRKMFFVHIVATAIQQCCETRQTDGRGQAHTQRTPANRCCWRWLLGAFNYRDRTSTRNFRRLLCRDSIRMLPAHKCRGLPARRLPVTRSWNWVACFRLVSKRHFDKMCRVERTDCKNYC
jgi:hypothetical protein